ncbi:MAG: cation diffusion facilitator family transporter [Thermoplasmata archaeon]
MGLLEEKIGAARLSVYSNSLLVALKVIVGLLMGSVAVVAEGLHSGVDLLAAMIARYSVKKSSEPADHDHMFGHGKFENLSGLIEGALIFVAAAWIIYEASMRILSKRPVELLGAGMFVMAVSMFMNMVVSRRLARVAKKTESLALEADALHLSTDVWTSGGVLVALILIALTGYQILDPVIAMAVAALIIKAAFDVTRRSAQGLVDRSLPEDEIKVIEEVMKQHERDFVDFHRLRARKVGPERQIDLHLTIPRNLSVKEGHDLAEHIEHEIKKRLPNCVIVIHVEPCDEMCDRCRMTPPSNIFKGGEKPKT